MLYYLYTLHKFQKPNNYPILVSYLKILTQLVLVTYVFIQLNFDLVSHNFGTKVDQFVDTSQNFLVLIVGLSITVALASHYLLRRLGAAVSVSPQYTAHSKESALVWHALAVLVITLILLSSFSLLINDFL
jgi:heme/copper-type cytochrome/quinol oxidase subunit 2